MTARQTPSRQKVADRLIASLGTFVTLVVVWVVLHLAADIADPFGLLSVLAGMSLLSAMVALFAVIVVASSLLRR